MFGGVANDVAMSREWKVIASLSIPAGCVGDINSQRFYLPRITYSETAPLGKDECTESRL